MNEEYHALIQIHASTLIPPPPSSIMIGCKWVYHIKRKQNGDIDHYKVHFMAKGFSQHEGIDFHETCSPIIKVTTIRTFIALTTSLGWNLGQLDIFNAFPHGVLNETIFMAQPLGFIA